MNEWLTAGAERSLGAVYDHIPPAEKQSAKEQLLTVVANRLLTGYAVDRIVFEGEESVTIFLTLQADPPDWDVLLTPPNLSAPVDEWFERDIAGLSEDIKILMADVPVEALSWGDLDLKAVVEEMCGERVPGWRISLMLRKDAADRSTLEIAFSPQQPLTLAVTPRISSSSIPVMLHSNLKEDLLKGFAPVIGIPVPWLDRHRDDLVQMSKHLLAEEYLVEKAKAEPEIIAQTGSVTELDIDLESRRYAFWVWMAVYAGTEDRYPEIGLHFGRRAQLFPRWDMELYTELIMAVDDWELESRFGMRWSPWRSVWLGGEWSSDDHMWWARASTEARPKKPYAWIRYSEDGDTNGAVGLRINEFMSIEVHYDSRDGDPWNVRALVNL